VYVPPGDLAARELAANPEKSDRGIAKELGVSHQTVKRERAKLGVTDVTPEKRIGRDGKRYPAKRKDPGRYALGSHAERAAEVAEANPSVAEIAAAYAAHAAEIAKANPTAFAAAEDLAELLMDSCCPPLQADVEWLTYFCDQTRSKRARLLAKLNDAFHADGTLKEEIKAEWEKTKWEKAEREK
jgi:hypothetical protein